MNNDLLSIYSYDKNVDYNHHAFKKTKPNFFASTENELDSLLIADEQNAQ